jgi:hypothetical protein
MKFNYKTTLCWMLNVETKKNKNQYNVKRWNQEIFLSILKNQDNPEIFSKHGLISKARNSWNLKPILNQEI